MGCCGAYDTVVQPAKGEPRQVEDHFTGPTKTRSCRDVVFLILFIAFIGGLGYVIYRAVDLGHPNRLIYGVDSWGNTCHTMNDPVDGAPLSGQDTTGLTQVFYYNPNYIEAVSKQDLTVSTIMICVSQCPAVVINTVQDLKDLAQSGPKLCAYNVEVTDYQAGPANGSGNCPPLPVKQHSSIFNRCIPSDLTNILNRFGDVLNKLMDLIDENFAEKCVEDLQRTWQQIAYLCGFALAVAIVMLVFLRFFAGPIVWMTVILIAAGCVGGVAFCWYSYTKEMTKQWLWGSIGATVVAVIILLILLVLRKRIKLVVQLFREAGKAIAKVPFALLMPFMTLIIAGGVTAGMVYAFLYIVTAKHPVANSAGVVSYREDEILKYLIAYYILGFLWITQFIFACQRLAVSGAVAVWYFTRDKSNLGWPIALSISRLVRYHLGSVAIGSLIIAIVKFIRLGLSFIEGRLKGAENFVAKFFLKCLGCCLWCFEKFLKFLNDNAYIQIAINGYGFCKAAKQAFLLIVNNALRVAAINCVGDFLLFLGKVGTVAVVAVVGIELFRDRTDVHYTWVPITVACIFAYFISSCFLAVYEMTIDAIFVCFVEDCDRNDGVQRPYYMSKGLMDFVKNSGEAKAMAKKREEVF
ncbi:choline transporter-like protein 1 [Haliotis cracherodii]|uniref:choline transporter-like protein 1 n=1 Tax=Haliotis cracherodii TaxID=6455 RepID=UPI0039EB01F4